MAEWLHYTVMCVLQLMCVCMYTQNDELVSDICDSGVIIIVIRTCRDGVIQFAMKVVVEDLMAVLSLCLRQRTTRGRQLPAWRLRLRLQERKAEREKGSKGGLANVQQQTMGTV